MLWQLMILMTTMIIKLKNLFIKPRRKNALKIDEKLQKFEKTVLNNYD